MSNRAQRRSWIDLLISGVQRLPGPSWLAYLVATVILVVAGTAIAWTDGTMPDGAFNFVRVFTDATVVYQLAVIHLLVWSGRNALARFTPALGELAPQYDQLERRLTTVPTWISLLAIPLGIAYAAAFLFGDPAGVGLTEFSSTGLWIFVSVCTVFAGVMFAALVMLVLRQLVTIVRIHSRATAVSIFDSAAHGSFARLTLRASVGLALPVYVFTAYQLVAGNPDGSITAPELVTVIALLGGAIGVFFIPLAGIHNRLARQKTDVQAAVTTRLGTAIGLVRDKIDSGDLSGMDELEKTVGVLVQERDAVRKLSTWPWDAETFRGFLSSIALPILLWFVTTLLGRLLGT